MKSLLLCNVLILGLVVAVNSFGDWFQIPEFPGMPEDFPEVKIGVHVKPKEKAEDKEGCKTCKRSVPDRFSRSADPRIIDHPRPCDDDYNCLSNAHCIAGYCRNRSPQDIDGDDSFIPVVKPDACFDDSHCHEDALCYEGHCTARKTKIPVVKTDTCSDDSQCQGAAKCREGQCKARKAKPGGLTIAKAGCTDNSFCIKTAECIEGRCILRKNKMSQLQVVKPDVCLDDSHCIKDAQCFEGRCRERKIRHLDVQVCDEGQECEVGECVNGICLNFAPDGY